MGSMDTWSRETGLLPGGSFGLVSTKYSHSEMNIGHNGEHYRGEFTMSGA